MPFSTCHRRCRPFSHVFVSRPLNAYLKPEESFRSLWLRGPSPVPQGFHNITELRKQTGDPLPLRHWHLILIILCISRSFSLQIVCPRSPRVCSSPVLTGTLRGSRNEADDSFQSHFAPDLLITQRPRVFSDPLYKDRHTYHQAISVIVQKLEAHVKRSSLSFRHTILLSVTQNLFDAEVSIGNSSACSGNSLDTTLVHRAGFFFPADIFASHLTILSTPGHPSRTGVPRIVVLLPKRK